MLQLAGIQVQDAGVNRLERCDVDVRTGEVLGIVGPAGSGKSTLIGVMAGLVPVSRGAIRLEGRDVTGQRQRLQRTAAFLDGRCPGPLDMTSSEWMSFWLNLSRVSPDERIDAAAKACRQIRLRIDERPLLTRSAGELATLNLARVWAMNPKLILLDSPAALLDGTGLGLLTDAIREASSAGTTIIVSDSSPHLPAAVCDRALILDAGTISAEVRRGEPQFESMIAASQGWAK